MDKTYIKVLGKGTNLSRAVDLAICNRLITGKKLGLMNVSLSKFKLLNCPAGDLNQAVFRTARSRTSGVYLFVLLFMMLHPAHELEPPANPARFRSRICA